MRVSILIPTCRRPAQLREALASLARQDPRLIGEILIGDDSPASQRGANLAEIAASPLSPLIRYEANDPPRGNYPNQWRLGERARCEHVLILHDDDQFCPGGLAALTNACAQETDTRVAAWFGRNQVMDAEGHTDPARTADEMRRYGKTGPGVPRPVWKWCLRHALPPNCVLMRRTTYLRFMAGPNDGNVGDWGLAVRLANNGAWARFIARDVSRYRVQSESETNTGRGLDAHRMYELAGALWVPPYWEARKLRLMRTFAPVATTRYLRDGERAKAWRCYLSEDWTWRARLSARGLAVLALLLTPAPMWPRVLQGSRAIAVFP